MAFCKIEMEFQYISVIENLTGTTCFLILCPKVSSFVLPSVGKGGLLDNA